MQQAQKNSLRSYLAPLSGVNIMCAYIKENVFGMGFCQSFVPVKTAGPAVWNCPTTKTEKNTQYFHQTHTWNYPSDFYFEPFKS